MSKDEAYFAAQAREAARGTAQLRLPKIEAASTVLLGIEAQIPELIASRDALGSGATRDALSNVISVVTSTRSILNGEQGKLNAVLSAEG